MRQTLVSEERVMREVKKSIAITQREDESSITPDTSLVRDLNAESLDFLDINYRLEQAFGIRMARHFVLEHIEEMFGEGSAIDENSRLTDKAVDVLKLRLGEDHPALKPGMDLEEVPSLITVQSVANGVIAILDTLPDRCDCGQSDWKSEDDTHIRCGSCGAAPVFINGDELTKQWLKTLQQAGKIV
jgi:acyl carrier protein